MTFKGIFSHILLEIGKCIFFYIWYKLKLKKKKFFTDIPSQNNPKLQF